MTTRLERAEKDRELRAAVDEYHQGIADDIADKQATEEEEHSWYWGDECDSDWGVSPDDPWLPQERGDVC